MRLEFERMCPSDTRKVLLILFCFAVMIAVVAPGGSNFLIAGAIMVDINHHTREEGDERDDYDRRIGAICLFGNGLTSAFNLVGVCIIAISSDISSFAYLYPNECSGITDQTQLETCGNKQIGKYFSASFFIFSVISPVLMAGLYNREKGILNKIKSMKPDMSYVFLFLCVCVCVCLFFTKNIAFFCLFYGMQ